MKITAQHVIEYSEDPETERAYWECGNCGRSGSCANWKVDIEAEKHVPVGESVVHRYVPWGER